MKSWHMLAVGFGLAAFQAAAVAQPLPWKPIESAPAAALGTPVPAASLGIPMAADSSAIGGSLFRGASPDPLVGDYARPARLGPISDVRFGPADDFPNTSEENFNWGLPDRTPSRPTRTPPSYTANNFGEKFGELFDKKNGHSFFNFESDHCFDNFISPVSNPFLAEDPRTLTELRPIFLFQTISHNNPLYRGGNAEFYGLQGRLAITDRFSIVLNKLGGMTINPGSGSAIGGATGLTELWLGPKYTWYRDDQTGTVAAAGLTFQIPIGSHKIFQDTGNFSLVPYASVAQQFGKTSFGTFNVMDTFGIAFGADQNRSNYFYNSIHVDFDVANWQRIYPLVELNWFHYTRNGHANNVGFEGQDLVNFGNPSAGNNYLGLAIGARYKFSESIQVGLAAQFPVAGGNQFNNFRLGIDMIWRY